MILTALSSLAEVELTVDELEEMPVDAPLERNQMRAAEESHPLALDTASCPGEGVFSIHVVILLRFHEVFLKVGKCSIIQMRSLSSR